MKKGKILAVLLSFALVALDVCPVMAEEVNVSANEVADAVETKVLSENDVEGSGEATDDENESDASENGSQDSNLKEGSVSDDLIAESSVSEDEVSGNNVSANEVSENSVSDDTVEATGQNVLGSLNTIYLKVGDQYIEPTVTVYLDADVGTDQIVTAPAPAKIQVPKGKLSKLMFPYVKTPSGQYMSIGEANFRTDIFNLCSGTSYGMGKWTINQDLSGYGYGEPYSNNTYASFTAATELYREEDAVQFEGIEKNSGVPSYIVFAYTQYERDPSGGYAMDGAGYRWVYAYAAFEIEIVDEDPSYVNPSIFRENHYLAGSLDNRAVWDAVREELWNKGSSTIVLDEAAGLKMLDMCDKSANNAGQDWAYKYITCFYDDWDNLRGWEGDYMEMHGSANNSSWGYTTPELVTVGGTNYYSLDMTYDPTAYTGSFAEHRRREDFVESYVANLIGPGGALDKTKYKSDYERISAAYNWVTTNVKYESGYNSRPNVMYYHAYAGFKEGKGSCEGMAQCFSYLCHELGVNCRTIYDKGMHVYNLVKLDGKWYATDCSAKKLLKGSSTFKGATLNTLIYGYGYYDYPYFMTNYINKMSNLDYGTKGGFTDTTFYVVKGKKVNTFEGTGSDFKSSKTSIATVDKKGVVKGKSVGTTKISCKVSGKTVRCTVKVVNKPTLTGVKTLRRGKKSKFKVKGGGGTTTWTSSNPAVACVDAKGKVTAIGKGTAKITAVNCGVKMSIKVKVK